jgi:hypothetical protein
MLCANAAMTQFRSNGLRIVERGLGVLGKSSSYRMYPS